MRKVIKLLLSCLGAAAVLVLVLGFFITPKTGSAPNAPVSGTKPFSSSSGIGCNYYRIPALLTTTDGTVLAAIDARFGGTHDSPNNIDTAVSTSTDSGKSWSEPQLVFQFDDFENTDDFLKENGTYTTQNSASVIDPALLQDTRTGRIFMLVDAFPYGAGAFAAQVGSGYTEIDGEQALLLRKQGDEDFSYTLRADGAIYDANGTKTAYTVNENGELSENGVPLTVQQKTQKYWYSLPFNVNTRKEVPMHIFYRDSLFQPLSTSYLYLLYSDDNGETWSAPIDLNAQVKPDDVGFFGVCPGRGLQIQNGTYAGRLLFCAYTLDPESGEQRFMSIFSDDGGSTWQAGEFVALTDVIRSMSETQLIELPDGSLQAYSRTTNGFVSVSFSADGGRSWQNPQLVEALPLTSGSGCQISVIHCSQKIDGKDAVLLSAPAGDSRTNGYIYVGLLEQNDDDASYYVNWAYKKEITNADTYFAYSCLTELPDGNIGLLYEQANTPQSVDTVVFASFSLSELCEEEIQ